MKLNETPVRTSRNFGINNVKLDDIEIPEIVDEFDNFEIINNNQKVKIESNCSEVELVYGLNDDLTNQINECSNKNIKIDIDGKNEKDINLNFKFDKDNLNLIENIEIIAKEEARATVIIKYQSEDDIECFHNGAIRLTCENGSKVNIVLVNLMNMVSNNFLAIENVLENDSKLKYTIIDFGGKSSITNYYSNLLGSNSDNTLNTILI